MSRLINNQPRQISIYRLQRRPSFGFQSLVSSNPMCLQWSSGSMPNSSVRNPRNESHHRLESDWLEYVLSMDQPGEQRCCSMADECKEKMTMMTTKLRMQCNVQETHTWRMTLSTTRHWSDMSRTIATIESSFGRTSEGPNIIARFRASICRKRT